VDSVGDGFVAGVCYVACVAGVGMCDVGGGGCGCGVVGIVSDGVVVVSGGVCDDVGGVNVDGVAGGCGRQVADGVAVDFL